MKDLILGLSFNWENWSAFDQFLVESLNAHGTSSTIQSNHWRLDAQPHDAVAEDGGYARLHDLE